MVKTNYTDEEVKQILESLFIEKRRVKVLKDYLFLATLQYNEGETDYLNVLDAERNLFNAQLDYAEAQAETFTTLIDLYRALGGGWVIDANEEYVFGNTPPLCVQDTDSLHGECKSTPSEPSAKTNASDSANPI